MFWVKCDVLGYYLDRDDCFFIDMFFCIMFIGIVDSNFVYIYVCNLVSGFIYVCNRVMIVENFVGFKMRGVKKDFVVGFVI